MLKWKIFDVKCDLKKFDLDELHNVDDVQVYFLRTLSQLLTFCQEKIVAGVQMFQIELNSN